MAEPKIKEKRWTVDLEKKIQEEHFAEGQRYTLIQSPKRKFL